MNEKIRKDYEELARDFFSDKDVGLKEYKLVQLVDAISMPKIIDWKKKNPQVLDTEFEIALEKVEVHVLKRYVVYFIKRNCQQDNYDPVEFVKWLHTTCKHAIYNYLKPRCDVIVDSMDQTKEDDDKTSIDNLPAKIAKQVLPVFDQYSNMEGINKINEAFKLVLSMPQTPLVLVWMYYMMLYLEKGEDKKSVLQRINDSKTMTLLEIYDYVVVRIKQYYTLINFSNEDQENLYHRLNQYYDNKRLCDYQLQDFYHDEKYGITKKISDLNTKKIRTKIKQRGDINE